MALKEEGRHQKLVQPGVKNTTLMLLRLGLPGALGGLVISGEGVLLGAHFWLLTTSPVDNSTPPRSQPFRRWRRTRITGALLLCWCPSCGVRSFMPPGSAKLRLCPGLHTLDSFLQQGAWVAFALTWAPKSGTSRLPLKNGWPSLYWRLLAAVQHDPARINFAPGQRERLMAKYQLVERTAPPSL